VAIKVYLRKPLDEDEYEWACASYAQEASIITDLRTRCLDVECFIQVYGVVQGQLPEPFTRLFRCGVGQEAVGIVMRHEKGGNLANLLHPVTGVPAPLDMKQKVQILLGIAKGINELHENNFIHSDIKPENVLLADKTSYNFVRLADFGQSKLQTTSSAQTVGRSTLRNTSTARGTPLYLAPEMFFVNISDSFASTSRSTDMYAFAILAWEVLTQKKPFFSNGINLERETLANMVKGGQRPSLDELPSGTPPSINDMIVRCWSCDRTHRLDASTCQLILEQAYTVVSSDSYDVFFSHSWADKGLLR